MTTRNFSPYRLPMFEATEAELEAFMLFGILAVRTNADVASNSLNTLLENQNDRTPYACMESQIHKGTVDRFLNENLDGEDADKIRLEVTQELLREAGCRFYKSKAKAVLHQVNHMSGRRLNEAGRRELLKCYGIGWKTSSFFILHTRIQPKPPVACLDVHILRYLRRKIGYRMTVPDLPPQTEKDYIPLENEFLNEAERLGVHPACLDVGIWIAERLKK